MLSNKNQIKSTKLCKHHIKSNIFSSSELALGEIHFWMGFHELLHFFSFLKFVWCWKALLFLPHIEHHFFHSRSCFTIEIRQFRRLGVDFLCVNFRITFYWRAPPWGLIFPFFNVYMNIFSFIAIKLSIFNGPISLFRVNFVFPLSVYQRLSFNIYLKFFNGNANFGVFLCYIRINKNEHFKILYDYFKITSSVWVQIYFSVLPPLPFGAG